MLRGLLKWGTAADNKGPAASGTETASATIDAVTAAAAAAENNDENRVEKQLDDTAHERNDQATTNSSNSSTNPQENVEQPDSQITEESQSSSQSLKDTEEEQRALEEETITADVTEQLPDNDKQQVKAVSPVKGKKRLGRPPKNKEETDKPSPRKSRRLEESVVTVEPKVGTDLPTDKINNAELPPPRKRGRPRKNTTETGTDNKKEKGGDERRRKVKIAKPVVGHIVQPGGEPRRSGRSRNPTKMLGYATDDSEGDDESDYSECSDKPARALKRIRSSSPDSQTSRQALERDAEEERSIRSAMKRATTPKPGSVEYRVWRKLHAKQSDKEKDNDDGLAQVEEEAPETGVAPTQPPLQECLTLFSSAAETTLRIIYHLVRAHLAAEQVMTALQVCEDFLVSYYKEADKRLAELFLPWEGSSNNLDTRSKFEQLSLLRENTAGLWCLYAHVFVEASTNSAFTVLHARTHPQKRHKKSSQPSILDGLWDHAMAVLEEASSCPFAGNHAAITLALARLRFRHCKIGAAQVKTNSVEIRMKSTKIRWLANLDLAAQACREGIERSSPLPRDASNRPPVQIVACDEVERLETDIGRTAIISSSNRMRTLFSKALGKKSTENTNLSVGDSRFLAVARLPHSLEGTLDRIRIAQQLTKGSQPDHLFVDTKSTRVVCLEMNRLSRLKESLSVHSDCTVLHLVCSPLGQPKSAKNSITWDSILDFQSMDVVLLDKGELHDLENEKDSYVPLKKQATTTSFFDQRKDYSKLLRAIYDEGHDDSVLDKVPVFSEVLYSCAKCIYRSFSSADELEFHSAECQGNRCYAVESLQQEWEELHIRAKPPAKNGAAAASPKRKRKKLRHKQKLGRVCVDVEFACRNCCNVGFPSTTQRDQHEGKCENALVHGGSSNAKMNRSAHSLPSRRELRSKSCEPCADAVVTSDTDSSERPHELRPMELGLSAGSSEKEQNATETLPNTMNSVIDTEGVPTAKQNLRKRNSVPEAEPEHSEEAKLGRHVVHTTAGEVTRDSSAALDESATSTGHDDVDVETGVVNAVVNDTDAVTRKKSTQVRLAKSATTTQRSSETVTARNTVNGGGWPSKHAQDAPVGQSRNSSLCGASGNDLLVEDGPVEKSSSACLGRARDQDSTSQASGPAAKVQVNKSRSNDVPLDSYNTSTKSSKKKRVKTNLDLCFMEAAGDDEGDLPGDELDLVRARTVGGNDEVGNSLSAVIADGGSNKDVEASAVATSPKTDRSTLCLGTEYACQKCFLTGFVSLTLRDAHEDICSGRRSNVMLQEQWQSIGTQASKCTRENDSSEMKAGGNCNIDKMQGSDETLKSQTTSKLQAAKMANSSDGAPGADIGDSKEVSAKRKRGGAEEWTVSDEKKGQKEALGGPADFKRRHGLPTEAVGRSGKTLYRARRTPLKTAGANLTNPYDKPVASPPTPGAMHIGLEMRQH